jgi:putative ABC transport system permease protein
VGVEEAYEEQGAKTMRLVRNVFRRKLRAFLTIFGITIGVFALVVMGGMAEKINLLVSGGTTYYADKVLLTDANSMGFGGTPMSVDLIDDIEKIEGVAAASASAMVLIDDTASMSVGMPPMAIGSDLRGDHLETFELNYTEGRALTPEDRGVAVVGADLVDMLNAEVGKTITIKGRDFEVVGIMDKTLTAPDSSVMISLPEAQELFVKSLPEMVQGNLEASSLATDITVYPEKGVDPDQLAVTLEAALPGIDAMGPKDFQEQIGSATKILNAIIFGVAMISLLVGGLSVINTMTMSVTERTREIGIRRAIGASNLQVVRQFLAEAGLIGCIGGLSGLVLGWAFTSVANAAGNDAGTALFLITSRLAIGSVVFAVFLGLVSGLYPSLHAARLHPVTALRYE